MSFTNLGTTSTNLGQGLSALGRASSVFGRDMGRLSAEQIAASAELGEALDGLGKSIKSLFSDTLSGGQGMKSLGMVSQAAANATSAAMLASGKASLLTKTLAGATKITGNLALTVAEQADLIFSTYQRFAQQGATTSGGIHDVTKIIHKLGYGFRDISEASRILSRDSQIVSQYSGSMAQGISDLADISQSFKLTGLRRELMTMGLTTSKINQGIADFMYQETISGMNRSRTDKQLISETAEFVRRMDLMTKLTGTDADSQRKKRDKAYADEALAATVAELGEKAREGDREAEAQLKTIDEIIQGPLPEDIKRELLSATGGDMSRSLKAIMTAPSALQLIQGKRATAAQITDAAVSDIRQLHEIQSNASKFHVFGDTYGDFRNQNRFLAQFEEKSYEEQRRLATEHQKVTDEVTNNYAEMIEEQMEGRDSLQSLVEKGIDPLISAFKSLVDSAEWLAKVPNSKFPEISSKFSTTLESGSNEISSIVSSGPGYLIAKRSNGSMVRLEGSRAWRNNNPGNLEYGNYAVSLGAIGSDGRFAIFPNAETGKKAQEKLLFEGKGYNNLTLSQAISRYAPSTENSTGYYTSIVLNAVGGIDKPLSQYSSSERDSILSAIRRMEGFRAGKTLEIGSGSSSVGADGINQQLSSALKLASDEYFRVTGKQITITSGFRDNDKQAKLYADYLAGKSKYPAAAPGKSKHNTGDAVDISAKDAEAMERLGLLGKYGLYRPYVNDPVHIELAKYDRGGISSGPKSGYSVILHGTEAVVPLENGKSIKVTTPQLYIDLASRTNKMKASLSELDAVLALAEDNLDLVDKIQRSMIN